MNQEKNSDLIISEIKRISPQVRAVFLGALFFGLFAHGMGLFNKYSHQDDVAALFELGATVTSGRWTLQIILWLESVIYGNGSTSLPLFNGIISILCVGAVGGLLVNLLKIRNTVYCALLGCLMVAFPMVTALFAYMFTSHPYMIGLLMMTVSGFLICKRTPWYIKVFAVFIGGAGIGVYQAFLSVLATILLFDIIMNLTEEKETWRKNLLRIGTHLLCLLGVLAVYAAGNRFFLEKYHLTLTGYQGISHMWEMNIPKLLSRCGKAFQEFFSPTQDFQDMYPGTLYPLYHLTLILEGIMAIRLIVKTARKNKGQAVLLTLLFVMVPLGCNLIYVIAEEIHALMVYGQVMQLVLLVWMVDRVDFSSVKLSQAASLGASLLLAGMAVMYARYDNQCYLKDALHQQEAISYYTTLVTRIKSLKGYRPEMEVYLTNTENVKDPTVYNIDELDFIRIMPYWHNSMEYLHCPSQEEFIKVWCGANFTWSWRDDLETLPEVQAMPAYPADGSIQIIDGVVVVKY